jgi:hypothetical protein
MGIFGESKKKPSSDELGFALVFICYCEISFTTSPVFSGSSMRVATSA